MMNLSLFYPLINRSWLRCLLAGLSLLLFPLTALAESAGGAVQIPELSASFYGYASVAIFILAYSLVPLENNIHLLKSKPVLVAAGLILGSGSHRIQ